MIFDKKNQVIKICLFMKISIETDAFGYKILHNFCN
jgi:hypothetical protein